MQAATDLNINLTAAAASAEVSYEQYVDVDAFKTKRLPLLHQDIARNTLVLTQLAADSSPAAALSILSCSRCSNRSVLVAGDNKGLGYSACYVSAGPCEHIASRLAHVLLVHEPLLHCDKVTLTAAAAKLLLQAQPAAHRWHLDHQLQLMVYSHGTPSPHTPTAADPSRLSSSLQQQPTQPCEQQTEHQHQHQRQQQQHQHQHQGLQLLQCTAEADAALVLSCAAAFLQEVFDMPTKPTEQQVAPGVLPRLQQGWYYALVDPQAGANGCAVCLVAHTPSSASSTRITMVYTPPEHRGRGHAKVAVRKVLQQLQGPLGYSSICLFADKDKPHIGAMYQGVGFAYVDELHTLKRPATA